MPAAFDQEWVKRLTPKTQKKGKNKCDLANQIRNDIAEFRSKSGTDRQVMIWCGSTEIYKEQKPVHQTLEAFEKGLVDDDPDISPSMLYAWAALKEGIPFANGAPNLTVDIPAMQELSKKMGAPICGKDFKTGQTLIKTVLAPGFKARQARRQRMVLDEHPRQPRRRGAGRSGQLQDQGSVEARRAGVHLSAGEEP